MAIGSRAWRWEQGGAGRGCWGQGMAVGAGHCCLQTAVVAMVQAKQNCSKACMLWRPHDGLGHYGSPELQAIPQESHRMQLQAMPQLPSLLRLQITVRHLQLTPQHSTQRTSPLQGRPQRLRSICSAFQTGPVTKWP